VTLDVKAVGQHADIADRYRGMFAPADELVDYQRSQHPATAIGVSIALFAFAWLGRRNVKETHQVRVMRCASDKDSYAPPTSNACARAISPGSLQAGPTNDKPTGNPLTSPAGTVIDG
jgi:hypothetical protein